MKCDINLLEIVKSTSISIVERSVFDFEKFEILTESFRKRPPFETVYPVFRSPFSIIQWLCEVDNDTTLHEYKSLQTSPEKLKSNCVKVGERINNDKVEFFSI